MGTSLKTLLTVRTKCVQYRNEIDNDFNRLSFSSIRDAEKQVPGLVNQLKGLVEIPYNNIIKYIDELITKEIEDV